MSSCEPYSGSRRKIVLAFDVGTTYSGVSYSILDPGKIPGINAVTRYPGQETSFASKIPTVIYYDSKGNVRAIGAETTRNGIYDAALEGGWYKAEWFKLHLRSKYGSGKTLHPNVPPLPPNKTVVDVFADFLRYLLACSGLYIQEAHFNGRDIWSNAKDDIHFVLSHPNGWEGMEQSQMRKAAVKAGLVSDTQVDQTRISFVTEGEASLHFAIENGILAQAMEGEGVVIVDAGGGTIDLSTYEWHVEKYSKRTFSEIAVAQCYFQGSVFVTFNANDHMKKLLSDSRFVDDVDHITDCFDKATKPRFRNPSEPQYVRFGTTRDNDPNCGIRFGQLKLVGTDVASFFQPSIDCVVQAIVDQKKSQQKISHIVLVGGFAASDWLFGQVKNLLSSKGLVVTRPGDFVNKAVSHGAVSFHLHHFVRTRVAKFNYGSDKSVAYNTSDPEHIKRSFSKFTHLDGIDYLPNRFAIALPKNTQVSESKEFSLPLRLLYPNPMSSSTISLPVLGYRGSLNDPKWVDVEPENFTMICKLEADFSRIPKVLLVGKNGKPYYRVVLNMVLNFGLTELQAQLQWWEQGVECRGPAKLIYD